MRTAPDRGRLHEQPGRVVALTGWSTASMKLNGSCTSSVLTIALTSTGSD